MKELFPEDEELYGRIKKLTDKLNENNKIINGENTYITHMTEDKKDVEKDKVV